MMSSCEKISNSITVAKELIENVKHVLWLLYTKLNSLKKNFVNPADYSASLQ